MRNIPRILRPALLTSSVIAIVLSTAHAQAPRRGTDDATVGVVGENKEESRISQKQMERLEARIATATAIVTRFEREAKARGLSAGWRQATLETLLPLPLEGLRQLEQQAFNLDALASATRDVADDPHQLGSPFNDLTYTPITPCRFIDTRNQGGKISGVRGFDIQVTGATYGGVAACNPTILFNLPPFDSSQIAALAMNVTLVDTSTAGAPGFVAVKPTAASPTTSLLNWYEQGPSVQVANQGIISLDQFAVVDDEFVIQTSGAVHIIVDIFGGFLPPFASQLHTVHVFDSVVVPYPAIGTLESPVCPAGFALTGGGCFTTHQNHSLSVSYPGGGDNRWACRSANFSGADSTLFARAICSRTPGR